MLVEWKDSTYLCAYLITSNLKWKKQGVVCLFVNGVFRQKIKLEQGFAELASAQSSSEASPFPTEPLILAHGAARTKKKLKTLEFLNLRRNKSSHRPLCK